jgi:cystathionine beta-lyase/cystathionine gamma-synthase
MTPSSTLATRCVHAGYEPEAAYGSLVPPIYQTTTFAQDAPNRSKGFTYSRSGNPTVRVLEERLAALEGTPLRAACTATGMASILLMGASVLKSGDEAVVGANAYGGTRRLFRNTFERFGVRVRYVDTSRPDDVEDALTPRTRLLLVETPSNPTLSITDIRDCAERVHDRGGLLAVDNTLLSPALQRPFEHGADLVVHSTTKYIDGHNATVGGALLTQDSQMHDRIVFDQNSLGVTLAPFDAWLTLQGLKTLPLRLARQCRTAESLARRLATHPAVARVHHPSLPDAPGRDVARRQQDGWGALVSFELAGGGPAADRLARAVRLWRLAENLGSVESLLTHPGTMTHAAVPPDERRRLGITDGLLRLSVGLEDEHELWNDLKDAFEQSAEVPADAA